MGKLYAEITPEIAAWVHAQPMFFVATAPLDPAGHVNCSPKGLDSLRVLDPLTVAYTDLTGSGAETVAHLRENGRIVLMFCAFHGAPKIVRFHGTGEVLVPSSGEWADLSSRLPMHPSARAIVRIKVDRVKMFVYLFSGLCAAIVGLIISSQLVAAHPMTGETFELNAIAAAVLGGTSMSGGRGRIGGTIIGAFVIGVLSDGLVMMGVSEFWQMVIKGLVIIAAVVLDQLQRRLSAGGRAN